MPSFTGFTTVRANSPALVQNYGWEFQGNAKLIQNKNFNWTINFNAAINKNKLVVYPDFELSPYVGQLVIGQPINIVRVLHSTGVDPQTGEYSLKIEIKMVK